MMFSYWIKPLLSAQNMAALFPRNQTRWNQCFGLVHSINRTQGFINSHILILSGTAPDFTARLLVYNYLVYALGFLYTTRQLYL